MATLFEQALYNNDSIPRVLANYEELLRSTGDIEDLAHATKLAEYGNIINSKSNAALRRIFDGFYNVLIREMPELRFRIAGRRKALISVEKKIQRSLQINKSLDLIRDLLGVRIILLDNDVANCYKVLELFVLYCLSQGFMLCEENLSPTQSYSSPLLNQFSYGITDYIADKKDNGYQSLHAVFRNSSGFCFEVQIRNFQMHADASLGRSSHDEYKKNKYADLNIDRDKINIPGYKATPEGIIDLIGLEYSVEILQRNKSF